MRTYKLLLLLTITMCRLPIDFHRADEVHTKHCMTMDFEGEEEEQEEENEELAA